MRRQGCWLLALWLFSACGGQKVQQLEESIINGTPDTSEAHLGVIFLLVRSSSGAWSCSGTLIRPDAVLSAGHCVVGNGGVIQPQEATVYFGNAVGAMTSRPVSAVYAHPGYQDTVPVPNDISILLLGEPAPAWARPIPPLPNSLRLTKADEGADIEYVGFGLDENGNSGRKLHVWGKITVVCDKAGVGCPGGMVPGSFCAQMQQGGTCSGDSGGPAFITREGVEYVAGITSYGDWNCSTFGCSTSADAHQDFIDEIVGTDKPQGARCATGSQCQSGYCVDGFCCESACAETCYACDLPKQEGLCLPAPDGHRCTDGDPCNGTEICQAGKCLNQSNPPSCQSNSPCLKARCQQGVGCVYEPVDDAAVCDDGNKCNGADTCQGGQCLPVGVPLDCDDHNPCTSDSCDGAFGCVHKNAADGTACGDGDACNGEETCQAGKCQKATPLDCDDVNPCTEDSCDPAGGCRHQELADGSSCGSGRTCQKGLCLPKPSSGGCASAGGGWALWLLPTLFFRPRRRLF
jgi:hypothetical protein